MEFSGTFELEDATVEEVWLALSDPELVWHALPGCRFLVAVDDEDPDFDALREEYGDAEPDPTLDRDVIEARAFEEGGVYAALLEVSVGNVSPSFRTVGTVEEREPYRMVAAGEGSSGNSSFEGEASMELTESDDGVVVDWTAEADVFGRVAQMGQRVINPTANRVIKRFFDSLQDTLEDLADEEAADDEDATSGAEDADASADAGDGDADGSADATDGTGESGTTADADDGDSQSQADDAGRQEDGGLVARLRRLLGLGT